MKVFVLLSVLLLVVIIVHSFDETGIGHPASFALSFLPQHDFISVPSQEIEDLSEIPDSRERSRQRGFYPQVRVGRAGNYYNPSASKKANKMTIFPRVGRGSSKLYTGNDCDERHATRDTSSNLWFGPRLGVHKRDNYELPLSYILLNGNYLSPHNQQQVHAPSHRIGGHGSRMEYIPIQDQDLDSEFENDKLDFESLN